jgi:hypothetical protein
MTSADELETHVDFAGIQALSSRSAGYSVAAKCLQVQADAEARDPALKSAKGVRLHDDAWSWYVGALGEIQVGEMLKQLGPGWFVRHAVPIGAGTKDVDHLVIGPTGIFAINTKHHADASIWVGDVVLRVNNGNTHHLKQAVSDGRDVARRLTSKLGFPVRVHSVLAVLNSQSIIDKRAADKRLVTVLDAERLVAWLVARPRQLSDTTLALIELAAEEPETWHIDPRAADTLRVMQRFERLAAQVGNPRAPALAPSRSRIARSRTTNQSPSRARGTACSRPTHTRGSRRATVGDLLGLWFAIGLIVTAILVIRGIANQPCTSPMACMFPPIYLVFKPFLVLGTIAAIGAGAIGTLIWIVRRVSR